MWLCAALAAPFNKHLSDQADWAPALGARRFRFACGRRAARNLRGPVALTLSRNSQGLDL